MFSTDHLIITSRITNRSRPCSRAAWILVFAIIGVWAASVQGMSQTLNPEDHLRRRMSEYWDAMQKPDYDAAATYIHPDSRSVFARIPRGRVMKWKIKSLGCNEDHTVCNTVTAI